jgi:hypothetical protein
LKTLTIKQDIIDKLDSDKSKLEFANSVITLMSGSGQTLSNKFDEALGEGLNSDLPEPMDGAPDFDSSNMSAPEVRRYSLLKAGYVPAGRKGLNCGYSGYEYKHLSDLSQLEFDFFRSSVWSNIDESKGKKGYVKFLRYLVKIYSWFYSKIILPSLIREDIDD